MMHPIKAFLIITALAMGSARGLWAQDQPPIHFMNENTLAFVLFDLLETAPTQKGRPLQWDMDAWIGKMYNRLWIRGEGELLTGQRGGDVALQALYSRVIAPTGICSSACGLTWPMAKKPARGRIWPWDWKA